MSEITLSGLMRFDNHPDRNGRIYPEEIMKKAINEFVLKERKIELISKINKKIKKIYGKKK